MWWRGLCPSPKKIIFVSKVITLGAFHAVFNKQKPWETDLRFNLETNLIKTVQNYPQIHSHTKGGGRTINPLNTPLDERRMWKRLCLPHRAVGPRIFAARCYA